ncbi:sigma-70 family RNA polymerase sigma factor [Bacillus sp. DJP31]|uniref:sigma-70 family RNA polymerase sigma factor n=1 Tax=Bacillus sp. DJP31 TaxID=3409789 RepID=UPI003BB59772
MEKNQSFQEVFEKEEWLIKSAIKDLHIYKNMDEYYQEGLIGFWEAYERFDPTKGAAFRTFAYKTIRGKLLTYLKKARRNEDREATLSDAVIEVMVDEQVEVPFQGDLISTYCMGLTEQQKIWVHKAFVEGKGPMQIAAEEGVSLDTVKSWRRYALQKMRMNRLI